MKIDRLFEIVYILIDKKTVTAAELAQRFEVSVRTVYRYIDFLSQAGIPVYTQRGKNGGISILNNFVLDKSLISDTEQTEIMSALSAMSALPNLEQTKLTDKLASMFSRTDDAWISVDFSDWNEGQKENFDMLREAVICKKVINISYINSRGEVSERVIEPLMLCFKSRAWYLSAYCRSAGDYRFFRLSRIKSITISDEIFERKKPDLDYGKSEAVCTEVTLRISPQMEYRVYDEFNDFERDDKGCFIVKTKVPANDWLLGYIMSFGEYAEVISPVGIRETVKEKIKKSLENYS